MHRLLSCLLMILLMSLQFVANTAYASNSTETLPAGISSPSIRMGRITGIEERYADNQQLYLIGDLKSTTFDAQTLSRLNKRAHELIRALNQFGTQELGNKLNLGVLRVSTAPEVNYFAPVFASGLSDRWTVAVGIPVIHYQNKITLRQEGSNLEFYRSQLSGLSTELDRALNTDLVAETHSTLAERGYEPLSNKNETFIGDIQLSSLFRFWENGQQAILWQSTLGLPTGPRYNSDDLAALNVFGRTVFENRWVFSQKLGKAWILNPYVGYMYTFPGTVTVRVPKDAEDILPDQTSKEDLMRTIGDTKIIGTDIHWDWTDALSTVVGYEISHKDSDRYTGDSRNRYDLLSKNTDADAQKISAQVSYSTVKRYLRKQSLAPGIFTFGISDIVSGRNVERRTVQEISLMMFF